MSGVGGGHGHASMATNNNMIYRYGTAGGAISTNDSNYQTANAPVGAGGVPGLYGATSGADDSSPERDESHNAAGVGAAITQPRGNGQILVQASGRTSETNLHSAGAAANHILNHHSDHTLLEKRPVTSGHAD